MGDKDPKNLSGSDWLDHPIKLGQAFVRKQITNGIQGGLKQSDKGFELVFDKAEKDLRDQAGTAGSPEAMEELNQQLDILHQMAPIVKKDFVDFTYELGRQILDDYTSIRVKKRFEDEAGRQDLDAPFHFAPQSPDYKVQIDPKWESLIKKEFWSDLEKIDLDFDAASFAKLKQFEWQKYMRHLGVTATTGCTLQIESFNASAAAAAGFDAAKDTVTVGGNVSGFWRKWTFSLKADWSYNWRDGEVAEWSAGFFFSLDRWGHYDPIEP